MTQGPKTYVRCANCKDIVYSKWPGHFAACSCFEDVEGNLGIAVDETRGYVRLVGGEGGYEILDREEAIHE